MKAGIFIKKVWFDADLFELNVKASDGVSFFSTNVYASHAAFGNLISALKSFKGQVRGGIHDVQLGEFGPEYAKGAFHARMHFHQRGHGRLFITVNIQADWHDFTETKVASQATLYLSADPASLDNFVEELISFNTGKTDEASLVSV